VRAEPIAAMYERGMVHHVGGGAVSNDFALLERELINFTTQGYKGAGSPNRADALVWACTALFGNRLAYGLTEYLATKTAEISKEQEERMQKLATFLNGMTAGVSIAKVDAVPADGKQPTAGCPKCGSLCIANTPSGDKRCSMCGEQWSDMGAEPTSKPQNRSDLFKNRG
jgi:ribosomal protein L37AE/L43A